MITISKISLTLQIEADGLAQLRQELAAWQARLMAIQAPTAQNGLETTRTDVPTPTTPARAKTAQIAPIAQPTQNAVKAAPAAIAKHNKRPVPPLPFAEFDVLCRAEMKRLSLDKRLPGRKLWDEERDRRLPTLDAVRMRYKCATLEQLAEELGFMPPLRRSELPANGTDTLTVADYAGEMAP